MRTARRASSAVLMAMALAAAAACGGGSGDGNSSAELDPIPPAQAPAFDAQRFADIEDATWRNYLRLQDALAHDRFEEALRAAEALTESRDTEVKILAREAAASPGIVNLRGLFAPLSEVMIARGAPEGFAVAYCPMAFDYEGARWVQTKDHIMNPYFGARMLRCGAFEDEDGAADEDVADAASHTP